MSVCHSCGQPNNAGALHCGFCGARLAPPAANIKKTMLGMAALSPDDLPSARDASEHATVAMPAPPMPAPPMPAPPMPAPPMPAPPTAAMEDPNAWPDPDGWGLDAPGAGLASGAGLAPNGHALAPPKEALADTLEANRGEMLRQIALDAELAQTQDAPTPAAPAPAPPIPSWQMSAAPSPPTPSPLEAPSRASDEALADTLEANREVMQLAMAELDAPKSAALHAEPKTVPVASLAPDLASRGAASWQGELALSDADRGLLDDGPRELGATKGGAAPSPPLKTTHWLLLGAVVLVFVGALLLAVAYFALLG